MLNRLGDWFCGRNKHGGFNIGDKVNIVHTDHAGKETTAHTGHIVRLFPYANSEGNIVVQFKGSDLCRLCFSDQLRLIPTTDDNL